MPSSSVLFFFMLGVLYRMICKNSKKNFGKNRLNVKNVKPFSNFFFDDFGCFLMSVFIGPLI